MLALFEKVLYIYEVITFDCKENGTYMRRIIIMKEKVVLAYSGGLDTTAIIPWLKETFDYDVICCCIDCGQNWTAWKNVQDCPALLNYILKTW